MYVSSNEYCRSGLPATLSCRAMPVKVRATILNLERFANDASIFPASTVKAEVSS